MIPIAVAMAAYSKEKGLEMAADYIEIINLNEREDAVAQLTYQKFPQENHSQYWIASASIDPWHMTNKNSLPPVDTRVIVKVEDGRIHFGIWDGKQWDLEHAELDHETPVCWMSIPDRK